MTGAVASHATARTDREALAARVAGMCRALADLEAAGITADELDADTRLKLLRAQRLLERLAQRGVTRGRGHC